MADYRETTKINRRDVVGRLGRNIQTGALGGGISIDGCSVPSGVSSGGSFTPSATLTNNTGGSTTVSLDFSFGGYNLSSASTTIPSGTTTVSGGRVSYSDLESAVGTGSVSASVTVQGYGSTSCGTIEVGGDGGGDGGGGSIAVANCSVRPTDVHKGDNVRLAAGVGNSTSSTESMYVKWIEPYVDKEIASTYTTVSAGGGVSVSESVTWSDLAWMFNKGDTITIGAVAEGYQSGHTTCANTVTINADDSDGGGDGTTCPPEFDTDENSPNKILAGNHECDPSSIVEIQSVYPDNPQVTDLIQFNEHSDDTLKGVTQGIFAMDVKNVSDQTMGEPRIPVTVDMVGVDLCEWPGPDDGDLCCIEPYTGNVICEGPGASGGTGPALWEPGEVATMPILMQVPSGADKVVVDVYGNTAEADVGGGALVEIPGGGSVDFNVTNIDVSPGEKKVDVSYTVKNSGGYGGVMDVQVDVDVGANGNINRTDRYSHSLDSGQSDTKTLSYDVAIDSDTDVKVCATVVG